MYCKNCGKQIEETVSFCPHCGTNLKSRPSKAEPWDYTYTPPQQPTVNVVNTNVNNVYACAPKNRWIAFFLCFFLGYIGAHRFYVGKVGTGILYLFTLGLFGIGSLVDLIVILCGGFKDKYGQHLYG